MLRSVIAIVAGFLLIGAASFGTDMLLRVSLPELFDANGSTQSTGLLLFTMLYVGVYATLGCYLTAVMAPSRPMKHALILGVLGLIFTFVGTMAQWDTAPALYHIASLLLVMPYAWLGGRLREKQLARSLITS